MKRRKEEGRRLVEGGGRGGERRGEERRGGKGRGGEGRGEYEVCTAGENVFRNKMEGTDQHRR